MTETEATQTHFFHRFCYFGFLPVISGIQADLGTLFSLFEQLMTLHEHCQQEHVLLEKFRWWKQEIYDLPEEKSRHPLCQDIIAMRRRHDLPIPYFESWTDGLAQYLSQGYLATKQDKERFHQETCASLFLLAERILNPDRRILSSQSHKALLRAGLCVGEARMLLRLSHNIQCQHCFFDHATLSSYQLTPHHFDGTETKKTEITAYLMTLAKQLTQQLHDIERQLRNCQDKHLHPFICLMRLIQCTIRQWLTKKNAIKTLYHQVPTLSGIRSAWISYQIWSTFQ